jgi:hypothetical protein
VYSPKTGEPVYLDEQKTPLQIRLLGRHSAVARDTLKQIDDERSAIEGAGRTYSQTHAEMANNRYLSSLTRGWNFGVLDGQEFPFTPANADKLWADPRWPHIKRQALAFVASDGNFSSV